MNVIDLPMSPPLAFASLSGKRPDLLLTPTRGHISPGISPESSVPPGQSRLLAAVFFGNDSAPMIIPIGHAN